MAKKELSISNVEFQYVNQPTRRRIKVRLNDGGCVYIHACHESWDQCNGTLEELRTTMPIAERYNGWLHGGNF